MYSNIFDSVMPLAASATKWVNATVSGATYYGSGGNDEFYSAKSNILAGGAGDDVYYIWSSATKLTEYSGQGTDTVYAEIWGNITLANNIENLFLKGNGAFGATGNASANLIVAGAVAATLDGMGGNDVLVGGVGGDLFKLSAGNGSDTIYGFQAGWDTITLSGYGINSFNQLLSRATQVGDDVRIAFSNDEKLLLRGVDIADLNAWDFGFSVPLVNQADHYTLSGAGKGRNYNGWYVVNNAWGATDLKQGTDYTIASSLNPADMTTGTTFSWSFPTIAGAFGGIKAFPEVIFGAAPMGAAANPTDLAHVFPVKVADLAAATAAFDVSHVGNMAGHNIAYDIWLTDRPYGGPSSVTNEIMVWVYKGDFAAFGTKIGRYDDGALKGDIYHTGTYTAIIADNPWLEGTLDIHKMLTVLEGMGIVSDQEYLASVELGAEVTSGVGQMTINSLTLNVQTHNVDGSITVKEVTGAGTQVSTILPEVAPAIISNGGGDRADIVVYENGVAVTHVLASDGNAGDSVRYAITGGVDSAFFTIDATTGALSFTAAPDFEMAADSNQNNFYNVVVTASDGTLSDSQKLVVQVKNVNEGPVVSAVEPITAIAGRSAAAVSLGARDPDGDNLTYTVKAGDGPHLGTVAFGQDGSLIYTAGLAIGIDDFIIVVSDGHGGIVEQSVSVTVSPLASGIQSAPGSSAPGAIAGGSTNDQLRGTLASEVIHGNGGDDSVWGGGGTDYLYGDAGSDWLYGGDGNDVIDGGAAVDYMFGGKGDDIYVVNNASDRAYDNAGEGRDTVYTSVAYTLGDNVEDMVLTGSAGLVAQGNRLDNRISGSSGNDDLYGWDGGDQLSGGLGGDILRGGVGNDMLYGGDGDDQLYGGSGDDLLYGGVGTDAMAGGAGSDSFIFASLEDFKPLGYDRIFDFSRADRDVIDLRGIDAVASSALDDAFTFIGSTAFTGHAGELRFAYDGYELKIYGDVSGDRVSDFMLTLRDVTTMQASDFLL